jgi:SAM-dependent methyltransferase
MRQVIDAAGFEAMYQHDIDPWNYAASPFEAYKRGVLLRACGPGPFGRALELACGTGATSRALASRCLRLTALDSSATAIAEARRAAGEGSRVAYRRGLLPRDMPRGPFDLIVASEILYYLRPEDLRRLLCRMEDSLAPGGRIVLLHHLIDFDDAATRPRRAQALAAAAFRRAGLRPAFRRDAGRFQAAAFVKGTGRKEAEGSPVPPWASSSSTAKVSPGGS